MQRASHANNEPDLFLVEKREKRVFFCDILTHFSPIASPDLTKSQLRTPHFALVRFEGVVAQFSEFFALLFISSSCRIVAFTFLLSHRFATTFREAT
jgi:hypothetical protein